MHSSDASEFLNSLRTSAEVWIFGYGSILWNTGYKCFVGYVDGFSRKFWQGNVTHRGTPESPGRVATLIPAKQGRVWGMAYRLSGKDMIAAALDHLGVRECSLGGYGCHQVRFIKRSSGPPIKAVTFVATPDNKYYLGPYPLHQMARQVVACSGRTGTNVEYVLRLAEFLRDNIPEDKDSHLFVLEKRIHMELSRRKSDIFSDKITSTLAKQDMSEGANGDVKEEGEGGENIGLRRAISLPLYETARIRSFSESIADNCLSETELAEEKVLQGRERSISVCTESYLDVENLDCISINVIRISSSG